MDEKKKSTSRFSEFLKSSGRILSVATAGVVLLVVWIVFNNDKPQAKPQSESSKHQMKQEKSATVLVSPIITHRPAVKPDTPVELAKAPAPKPARQAEQWQLFGEKGSTGKSSRTAAADVEYDDYPLPNLRQPRIVIEKSKLRLSVYDGRRLVKRYRAAVGGNRGDKIREGDHRTPEGEFYVCVRNTRSKYVLSLGLSYPNIDDARRGLRAGLISQTEYNRITYAIRRGQQPPWKTKLGGEIMIHGYRKGGRDTKGCIALEDNDIRELFPQIPNGTKVTILP